MVAIMINWSGSQFKRCLCRETQYVFDEQENKIPVIYRRNEQKNSTTNYLTIYYDLDTNIMVGDYLLYQDEHLLVLNSESLENNSYKKSDLVKCNQYINIGTFSQQLNPTTGNTEKTFVSVYEEIPCFAENTLSTQLNTQLGSFDQTKYTILCSAKYPIATEQTLIMSDFTMNSVTGATIATDTEYDIQSIDISNVIFEDAPKGILSILAIAEI